MSNPGGLVTGVMRPNLFRPRWLQKVVAASPGSRCWSRRKYEATEFPVGSSSGDWATFRPRVRLGWEALPIETRTLRPSRDWLRTYPLSCKQDSINSMASASVTGWAVTRLSGLPSKISESLMTAFPVNNSYIPRTSLMPLLGNCSWMVPSVPSVLSGPWAAGSGVAAS